jgi:hypothetical protein
MRINVRKSAKTLLHLGVYGYDICKKIIVITLVFSASTRQLRKKEPGSYV